MSNNEISVRKGLPGDAPDFPALMLIAGKLLPFIYGKKTESLLHYLYTRPGNLYSFENTFFAEIDGKIAGGLLGYTDETSRLQQPQTVHLMVSFFRLRMISVRKRMKAVREYMGNEDSDYYYIDLLATYPEYRKRGIGKTLVEEAIREAGKRGKAKVVLDVLADNEKAISLYREMGFIPEGKRGRLDTGRGSFEYIKMIHNLAG